MGLKFADRFALKRFGAALEDALGSIQSQLDVSFGQVFEGPGAPEK
jgi:hypothetical protein